MNKYDLNENEELEFAELERTAVFYPFASHSEYLVALSKYSHPMHPQATALRKKRAYLFPTQYISEENTRKLEQYEAIRELQATGEY